MKILHITNVDTVGGTNLNCLHLIRASSADHTLLVLDRPGQMNDRWSACQVELKYLDVLRKSRAAFVDAIGKASGSGYDIILVWCCIRVPLIRYALRRSGGRVGIHLGNPRRRGRLQDWSVAVQDWILRSQIQTKFFSCSEYVRNSYQRLYWRRFENRVIYNPVELECLPAVSPLRDGEVRLRIGMVARMDPIKDFPTFVRAVRLVRAQVGEVEVELVGDGPQRVELEALVERLGLSTVITFIGYVRDVEVYLARWNVFVYSTTECEGLGNALVEALGSGLPCLASDLPMLREIDGGQGLIDFFRPGDEHDLADKIVKLLRNSAERKGISELGRQHVLSRHNPSAYAQQVIEYVGS